MKNAKKTTKLILDDKHPQWRDFVKRTMDFGMSDCDTTHSLTRRILHEFDDIDIRNTLKWMSSQGGHCACEVMFNVVSDDLLSELSEEKEEEQ